MIVAVTTEPTGLVVTLKVFDVLPLGIETLAGTVAAALLLVSEMVAPPVGAEVFRVTVPVEDAPPITLLGFKVSDANAGGFTVSVAFADVLSVAVITALATDATFFDVTVNVAVVAPVAMVTLLGTVAALVLLLDRTIFLCADVPEAAAVKVTVPTEFESPPVTAAGVNVTDWTEFVAAKLEGPAHKHKQASAQRINRILKFLVMDFTE